MEEDIKIFRENDNAFKISVPLITSEEMESINNNFHSIVNEYTKQALHQKELAMAQYIIKKQEVIINEMAEQLVGLSIYDKDKELVIFKNEEEVKEYFTNKVEREGK